MSQEMTGANLHLPNLTIQGFRGIADLTIPTLGRVNLITGRNNTGKSSILEAFASLCAKCGPTSNSGNYWRSRRALSAL